MHGYARLVGRLAELAHAFPGRTLAAAAGLTLTLGFFARDLGVDAELTALLPDDFTAIEDLRTLEERYGGLGYLVVIAEGVEVEQLRSWAEAVSPTLEALKQVRYVEIKRPLQWFEDRALYFVDLPDLKEAHQRVRRRVKWEKRKRNPMYVELDEDAEDPPPLKFDDLLDKYQGAAGQDLGERADVEPYYMDAARRQLAVLIKPDGLGADLDFAKRLVVSVKGALADVPAPPGLRWSLTGRFAKWPAQQRLVMADLNRVTLLALVFMVLYLIVHFRRLAAVFLVVVPLALAIVWTIGAAALFFDKLNILTGLVGAILLGLGVDHGIHLLGRYEVDRDIRSAFGDTGRAVAIAALTTLGAFAAVAMSEFRAFHEFGVVAGLGMVASVLSYTLVLPALIGLLERTGWRPRVVPHADASRWGRLVERHPAAVLGGLGLLVALLLTRAGDARFDYDFGSLEAQQLPEFMMDPVANHLLGYSEMPVVVLTPDAAVEGAVVTELRRRKESLGDRSTIDRVASISDLVPKHQEAKAAELKRLQRTLKTVKSTWIPEKNREDFERLRRMAKAAPWTRGTLPKHLRQAYGAEGESAETGQVMAFPAIDTRDGRRVMALCDEVTEIPLPGGETISAAGDTVVMGALLRELLAEIEPILGLTLGLVILVLLGLLLSVKDTLLGLFPAFLTVIITVGLMGWSGVSLNYLNVSFVPVLFGVAVDGGVHLLIRVRAGDSPAEVIAETGRAITGALLTTALGFGALLFAAHPGLRSVGELMLLGLLANFVACLVALPAGMSLFRNWRNANV